MTQATKMHMYYRIYLMPLTWHNTFKIPTHNKGHTRDLIITTKSTRFNNVGDIIPVPYILDHRPLIMETTINKIKPKRQQPIQKINWKHQQYFKEKFNDKEILNSTILKDAINHFATEVVRSFEETAPHKTMRITNRKPKTMVW